MEEEQKTDGNLPRREFLINSVYALGASGLLPFLAGCSAAMRSALQNSGSVSNEHYVHPSVTPELLEKYKGVKPDSLQPYESLSLDGKLERMLEGYGIVEAAGWEERNGMLVPRVFNYEKLDEGNGIWIPYLNKRMVFEPMEDGGVGNFALACDNALPLWQRSPKHYLLVAVNGARIKESIHNSGGFDTILINNKSKSYAKYGSLYLATTGVHEFTHCEEDIDYMRERGLRKWDPDFILIPMDATSGPKSEDKAYSAELEFMDIARFPAPLKYEVVNLRRKHGDIGGDYAASAKNISQ